jgi:hypothetical protein
VMNGRQKTDPTELRSRRGLLPPLENSLFDVVVEEEVFVGV